MCELDLGAAPDTPTNTSPLGAAPDATDAMPLFGSAKPKKGKPRPGPRQLLITRTLRAAYPDCGLRASPLKIENTGAVWADESEFRILVVSKAFESLEGTRKKPGGAEPESMGWLLRQRKVLATIEAAGEGIDRASLYPVPLTPAEWDGEATVPVEPSAVGELGIGAWGSSSSEDEDDDAPKPPNPRTQWSCLNDPANRALLARPEAEVLGPMNHGESREAVLPQWVKDYGTPAWVEKYGPLDEKEGVRDPQQWVEDADAVISGPTCRRFQKDRFTTADARANDLKFF